MSTLWFYWGQKEMSFLRWMTLLSAIQIHNDVTLILRRDPISPKVKWKEKQDFQKSLEGYNWIKDLDALSIKKVALEDFAPEIAKLNAPDVQTADLLAWWILANYGGCVADMDIVFLKPLPEIKQDVEVVVFKNHPKPKYMPVTIMQGRPCSVWQAAYKNALEFYDPNIYESCGAEVLVPKPEPALSERIVFPWAGEYPWSSWHKFLFEAEEWPKIPDDCCGIHWYAGHNQKYNQAIRKPKDLGKGAVAWSVREALRDESIGG